MRNSLYIIGIAAMLAFVSCGSKNDNKKSFNPKDRTTTKLSIEERDAAIAAKRAEFAEISMDTLLSPHSVRMSVLPPAIKEDITEAACSKAAAKLLQIASKNGISGVNGSSPIAIALGVQSIDRAATGTAPQKMIVKYETTFYVLNTQTGDVYGSASSTAEGVGNTFENAAINAMESIKNTPEISKMITEADKRIVSWFDHNAQVIINKVNAAVANKDFALALALCHSVPEQSKSCHAAISKLQESVIVKFKQQVAAEELAALKNAVAQAGSEYTPEAAAHLAMLPPGSNEYKQGHDIYNRYIAHINKVELEKMAAEERARREEFELQKLQMKYDAEAAARAGSSSDSDSSSGNGGGFFSNLASTAKTFLAGAGAASIVGNVLSRCLFVF